MSLTKPASRTVLLLFFVVLVGCVAHVHGWGSLGHRTVAQLAYDRLAPQAKAVVDRYLDGSSLASAAVYPDAYRSNGGAWSSSLHYVNFPRDATHYLPAYCGNPAQCVVAAVANYTRRVNLEGLKGPMCGFTKGQMPCPLSFLAHFIGDIHQPLHCGYADDKGGNNVKVTFFGKSTNLHSLWDSAMLERFEPKETLLVQYLEEKIADSPAKVKQWLSAMDPAEWAEANFQIVRHDAYRFQDPQAARAVEITEEYYAHNAPIILDQLAAAGVRLAYLLNSAFA